MLNKLLERGGLDAPSWLSIGSIDQLKARLASVVILSVAVA